MANFRLCLYLALCGIALISSNANGCFEEGVAYPGNDLERMTASSPGDCQIACQQTNGCKAFTFREKSKNEKREKICFLKKSKLGKRITGVTGATSGDRNCVPYFVQLGNELCTGTEIIDTVEECKEAIRLLDLSFMEILDNYHLLPKGCFIYGEAQWKEVYWNNHKSGRESSDGHPICKNDTTS